MPKHPNELHGIIPRLRQLTTELENLKDDRFALLHQVSLLYLKMGPGKDRVTQARQELEFAMAQAASCYNDDPPFTQAHEAELLGVTPAKLAGMLRRHHERPSPED